MSNFNLEQLTIRVLVCLLISLVVAFFTLFLIQLGDHYKKGNAQRVLINGRMDGATQVIYDIPPLVDIAIDGEAKDWESQGFNSRSFAKYKSIEGIDIASSMIKLGWSGELGLKFLLEVNYGNFVQAEKLPSIRTKVELLNKQDAAGDFFLVLNSGNHKDLSIFPQVDQNAQKLRASLAIKERFTNGKYIVEGHLPLLRDKYSHALGSQVSLNVEIEIESASGSSILQLWRESTPNMQNLIPVLRFSNYKDEPVLVFAKAMIDTASKPGHNLIRNRFTRSAEEVFERSIRRKKIKLYVDAQGQEYAGKRIVIRSITNRQLSEMQLDPSGQGFTEIECSRLHAGRKRLLLFIDGKLVQSVDPVIESVPDNHVQVRPMPPLKFESLIFSQKALPEVELNWPVSNRWYLGGYSISTKYFDRQLNRVFDASDKFGRFGAVTEIVTEDGSKSHAFTTLFRSTRESDARILYGARIPRRTEDEMLAIELASGLRERGGFQGVKDYSAFDMDQRWWISLKEKLGIKFPYLVTLPTDYYLYPTRLWPVIVYCHGGGAQDIADLKVNLVTEEFTKVVQGGTGPFATVGSSGIKLPFVVLEPALSVENLRWTPAVIKTLLKQAGVAYRIDPRRVILTGYSSGTTGAWRVAIQEPELFAGFVPVSGQVPDTQYAGRLKHLPVWLFHGGDDKVVTPKSAVEMAKAIQGAGGEAKVTILPGVGHAASQKVWQRDDIWVWMLRRTRFEKPVDSR